MIDVMKEQFETPKHPDRQKLFEELASTLKSKTSDAIEGVEGVEEISFWVKPSGSWQVDSTDELYDEDIISGKVVTQFKDEIPLVKDKLSKWFGTIEVGTKGDDLYLICIIQEHVKPVEWSAESEKIEMPEMPNVFIIYITSLHEGWDEWLKNVGLV